MRFGRGLRVGQDIGTGAGIAAGVGAVAGGATAAADNRSIASGMFQGAMVGGLVGGGIGAARGYGKMGARGTSLFGAGRTAVGSRKAAGAYAGQIGMNPSWLQRRKLGKLTGSMESATGSYRSMAASPMGRPGLLGYGAAAGAAGGMAYATLPSNLSMQYRDASLRQRLQYDAAKAMIWQRGRGR